MVIVQFCHSAISSHILNKFAQLLRLKSPIFSDNGAHSVNLVYSFTKEVGKSYYPIISQLPTLFYSSQTCNFLRIRKHCLNKPIKECIPFYRWTLDAALISAILRGSKLAEVHGALLEMPDGRGILLIAESRVGKSTTCRRWEAAGGKYTSDDMILLEYDTPDGIIAHPMPTWSRCQQSLEGLCYPIEKCIPLAGVLVLSRAKGDEPEAIRPIPYPEFLCQVYQSCIYFHNPWIKVFPESMQKNLIANNQSCARKLCSMFPPRALKARLDGDLRETLKEFL